MAQPYLSQLQSLLERLFTLEIDQGVILCKHFFSGAAAYIDGQIFMSTSPVGLALKLSKNDCSSLFSKGAMPLRYFPKAPVKKGYAVLPVEMVDDEKILKTWIDRSIADTKKTLGTL